MKTLEYTDIEQIEKEGLPKLTAALELVKRGRKSGVNRYRVAWVGILTKSYRLGRDVTYENINGNDGISVSKPPVNEKAIKLRAKLITGNGFSRYRYNKLFLKYDVRYKGVQNQEIREGALVEDWIARLSQLLATECQNMMGIGASATGMTAELK